MLITQILESEDSLFCLKIIFLMIACFAVSARFFRQLDTWDWFVVYFGLGTLAADLVIPVFYFGGFFRKLSLVFTHPKVVFLIIFPPFGWLNLFGAVLCFYFRKKKELFGYKLGIGLIAIGALLSGWIFVVFAAITDFS